MLRDDGGSLEVKGAQSSTSAGSLRRDSSRLVKLATSDSSLGEGVGNIDGKVKVSGGHLHSIPAAMAGCNTLASKPSDSMRILVGSECI